MRTFLVLTTCVGLVLIGAALWIEIGSSDPNAAPQLANARLFVWSVGAQGWAFARPLLQLIIVLLIVEWLFARTGFNLGISEITTRWNAQTFIAGLIVTTFCISVLADIQAVAYLKDVVLIVIGFYFGSRAQTVGTAGDPGASPVQPAGTSPAGQASSSRSTDRAYEETNPAA